MTAAAAVGFRNAASAAAAAAAASAATATAAALAVAMASFSGFRNRKSKLLISMLHGRRGPIFLKKQQMVGQGNAPSTLRPFVRTKTHQFSNVWRDKLSA